MSSEPQPGLGTDAWHEMARDVEESNRARERYIPIIERTAGQVDMLHDRMVELTVAIKLLADKIGPMATVHDIVMKFLRFSGGVAVGTVATIVGGVAIWWITRRLMS